ncbi:MAG TPA: hypothetical protein P5217_06000 [Methanoregulaceae archaeon]|nr:hypothetical protein [Methanoregulaceae archaeon]HRY75815.1 hypothetical protein [Methanoregulaceae archaeon]
MEVIKKGKYRDFNLLLAYLTDIERAALEDLELSKSMYAYYSRKRAIKKVTSMSLADLRLLNPEFLLPPLEGTVTSRGEERLQYFCPYCHTPLVDDAASLSCRSCSVKPRWLKD